MATRARARISELEVLDFSGGWNIRDAPSQLGNNESPDCENVTLNERGGVEKRLGHIKRDTTAFTATAPPQKLHEGLASLTQCGAGLFKQGTLAAVHTFSTAARVDIAEFNSVLYAIHPVDGLYTSADGVTWTAVIGAPAGACLAAWQNRLLAGGDPSHKTRLYGCAVGDPLNWATAANRSGSDMVVTNGDATVTSATGAFTSADLSKTITIVGVAYRIATVTSTTEVELERVYEAASGGSKDWATSGDAWTNDVREGNDAEIVGLSGASGVDIIGQVGLLVWKNRSLHRVYDPDTGAYQTIDTAVGAPSQEAIVDAFDRTFCINERGIWWTDGNRPLQLVSQKLDKLFQPTQIAYDQAALFCAGWANDRVHFSLPRAGSTANDLHLEYHPAEGWIVPHTDAVSCYATRTDGDQKLYGGSTSADGQVYTLGVGGTDDGVDIACYCQTKWFPPANGLPCSFRRVLVFGRGLFDLYTKLDFDTGAGELTAASLPGGAGIWNESSWGDADWAPANYEDSAEFWSLGHGSHISFVFRETGSATAVAPKLLGVGDAPEVGVFAVYGLVLQFIPIGV